MSYTLFWTREDVQGDINMGEYASEDQAWLAQSSAHSELRRQCPAGEDGDDCRLEIDLGTWSVEVTQDPETAA